MSELGHFRRIDPLPTVSACPLRFDRVRTFAPQRIVAKVESRMGAVAWAMRQRSVSHRNEDFVLTDSGHRRYPSNWCPC